MTNDLTLDPTEVSFDFGLGVEPTPTDTVVTNNVEPTEPIDAVEPDKDGNDPSFDDYSDFALSALHLKEKGYLAVEDVPKDLTLEGLVSQLELSRQKESEEYKQLMLEEAREFKNLLDLRIQGIDQEVVDDIVSKTGFSKLKIDLLPEEETDQTIADKVSKNRERIIVEALKYRGIPDSEVQLMLETYKDKGLIEEKSKASQKFFEDEEVRMSQAAIDQKNQYDAYLVEQQQFAKEKLESILSSKVVGGYKMEANEVEELKSFISNPTEVVVERGVDGKPISRMVTPLDKKIQELSNDLEAQLSFALWLMKGKNFSSMKSQGRVEQHNALFNAIQKRTAEPAKKVKEPTVEKEEFISSFLNGELY